MVMSNGSGSHRQVIMKISVRKAVVVGSVALLAGSAMAGDIYKYVDEDGTVHYGDRPTGEASEQRMAVVSRSTTAASVDAQIDQLREREARLAEDQKRREVKEQEAAEARADAEDRAAKCQENRNRLVSYGEARRLYKQDESGERVYLDESERKAAEAQVRELIAKYCN